MPKKIKKAEPVVEDKEFSLEGLDDVIEDDEDEVLDTDPGDEVEEEEEEEEGDSDEIVVEDKTQEAPAVEEPTDEALLERLAAAAQGEGDLKEICDDLRKALTEENVTTEAIEKLVTLFEAAVSLKAKEKVDGVVKAALGIVKEESENNLKKTVSLVERLIDPFAKMWLQENIVNTVDVVTCQLAEGALKSVKQFMNKFNVRVPRSRENLVEKLATRNAGLQDKLDKQLQENIKLQESLTKVHKENQVREIAEGLSDTEREKFAALAGELPFVDEDSYRTKLTSIREGLFKPVSSTKTSTDADEFASKMLIEKKEEKKEEEKKKPANTAAHYLRG